MSSRHDLEADERSRRRRSAQKMGEQRKGPEAMPPGFDDHGASLSLLSRRKSSKRGNSQVQAAAITQIQQTRGNRYAQRVVQRSAQGGTPLPGEDFSESLRSKSGGTGLAPSVQRTLEAGLGADLSGVRVHTDDSADRLARSVNATAFTSGSDIYFRSGAYNPASTEGLHLLAHEATHTVQQSKGPVSGTTSAAGISISDPSDSFEQSAEVSARRVVNHASSYTGTTLRQPLRVLAGAGNSSFVQRAVDAKKPESDSSKAPGNKDDKGGAVDTSRSLFAKDDDSRADLLRINLKEADEICKKIAALNLGPETRKHLEEASQKLSLLTGAIGTNLSLKEGKEGDAAIVRFTKALKDLQALDAEKERSKAAEGLSELFAATGDLASVVTADGPWQGYLKNLGEDEAFFAPAGATK